MPEAGLEPAVSNTLNLRVNLDETEETEYHDYECELKIIDISKNLYFHYSGIL